MDTIPSSCFCITAREQSFHLLDISEEQFVSFRQLHKFNCCKQTNNCFSSVYYVIILENTNVSFTFDGLYIAFSACFKHSSVLPFNALQLNNWWILQFIDVFSVIMQYQVSSCSMHWSICIYLPRWKGIISLDFSCNLYVQSSKLRTVLGSVFVIKFVNLFYSFWAFFISWAVAYLDIVLKEISY